MADKNIKVCYGVDINAVAGWIGRPTRATPILRLQRLQGTNCL